MHNEYNSVDIDFSTTRRIIAVYEYNMYYETVEQIQLIIKGNHRNYTLQNYQYSSHRLPFIIHVLCLKISINNDNAYDGFFYYSTIHNWAVMNRIMNNSVHAQHIIVRKSKT